MSYELTHITKDEILNGFEDNYYCCMSGVLSRKFQCDMWPAIFDRVGSIGLLTRSEGRIVGQLIYIPKHYAQRIGMPRGEGSDDMESTMVISCVRVHDRYKNQGIASNMIREAINFCKQNKYRRIEAYVDPRTPLTAAEWVPSFSAFRKFGFAIEGPRIAWESKPDSRICCLLL